MRRFGAAVGAVVLFAGGCGGDDGDAAVRKAAEKVFEAVFAGDTDAVLAAVTPCSTEEEKAVRIFVPTATETESRSEVTGVEVVSRSGDEATVRVSAERDGEDIGQSPPMTMRRVEGTWRLDCRSLAGV